jgi:RNA polymerase sigma factor (sigma-70 family)
MRTAVEDLLRDLAPQVLGALVRRLGHFHEAEDAVQEAMLAASVQWPRDGLPDNPRGWLVKVAYHRMTDQLRSDSARRRREEAAPVELLAPPADVAPSQDDTLAMLFLCCHPALTPASQIPLTLRAVGGLTTEEIARAFLVPEATMAKRITRAKQRIKDSGVPFSADAARLPSVLHTLYLIFNEGYAATSGEVSLRSELTGEAIRLTRLVHRILPADPEVTGLLALMLLTEARSPARVGFDGALIPMAAQDRSRWHRSLIAEGTALVSAALASAPQFGPYLLQAALAAVHDEAARAEDTDWPQILALYQLLLAVSDTPVVRLNHAVAVAMVHGPAAGLALLPALEADESLTRTHRLDAVRAHLLELAGDHAAARVHYSSAARRTLSTPERRYLEAKVAALSADGECAP